MLSHIFTQFLVLVGQTTITLVFIFLVFEIPCNGPIAWIVVIAILQGFAGMCFGKKNVLKGLLYNKLCDAMAQNNVPTVKSSPLSNVCCSFQFSLFLLSH